MAQQEPQSWAEALKNYETVKRQSSVPTPDVVPKRTYRDARFNKLDEQRQYDILSHQFRDTKKERVAQEHELKQKVDKLVRARDLALRYEAHFDITNGLTKVEGKDPDPVHKPRITQSYKSSFTLEHHESLLPGPNKPLKPLKDSVIAQDRGYDIVNNRFFGDHDRVELKELQQQQDVAQERLREQPRFNPVTATYENPVANDEALGKEERLKVQQKELRRARLPPSVSDSEGTLYDITSFQVKDASMLEKKDARARRKGKEAATKYKQEKLVKSRSLTEEDRRAMQMIGRVAQERFSDEVQRGYDILSGQAFDVNSKLTEIPHQARPRIDPGLLQKHHQEPKQLSSLALVTTAHPLVSKDKVVDDKGRTLPRSMIRTSLSALSTAPASPPPQHATIVRSQSEAGDRAHAFAPRRVHTTTVSRGTRTSKR